MHRRHFHSHALVAVSAAVLGGCNSKTDAPKTSATDLKPGATPRPSEVKPRPPARSVEDVLGGREAVTMLNYPNKVEAFRLKDSEYQKTIDQYTQVGDGVPVSRDMAAQFAKLFSNTSAFRLDAAKGCVPVYGVQVRFAKGRQTLDLLFCFACDVFLTYLNGKQAGGEDFDPIRPQLVAIMKSLFPKDEVIQNLKDVG